MENSGPALSVADLLAEQRGRHRKKENASWGYHPYPLSVLFGPTICCTVRRQIPADRDTDRFTILGCCIELRRKLRLEAARSFSPHTWTNIARSWLGPSRRSPSNSTNSIPAPRPTTYSLVGCSSLARAMIVCLSSSALMADLKPRMLSPIPLPNSGSFLGPNTRSASPKITSRCIG